MKTILAAINASYVHTNPAVRSLAASANEEDIAFCEYNINQPPSDILYDLLKQKGDVVCLSCYIWNIGIVLRIAEDLKQAVPGLIVILGGPEVSFEAMVLMETAPFVDYIMCGEGEVVFPYLLKSIAAGSKPEIDSVLCRIDGKICGDQTYAVVDDIEQLPAPFAFGQDTYDENRIYYYESTRGCPFSCAYCLSGVIPGGVREKSVDKVKGDIARFVERGARLVKFTDRTFNANRERAIEIWKYVIKNTGDTCFHFEIGLDLLDAEALSLLREAPKGKIQIEAGIQSLNSETLQAVIRKTDIRKLKSNALSVIGAGNIHLHLDLIAGLPYEYMKSFERSFIEVYALYPDALQLGFLKLLKGTTLKEKAEEYGIAVRSYPPYEVLKTLDLQAEELLLLREIAGLVDRYYNTKRMRGAFDFVTKNQIVKPFAWYLALYRFSEKHGYAARPVGARHQFELMIAFAKEILNQEELMLFLEKLKADYQNAKIKGIVPQELREIN
ncbi:MAG: DUF4080 domain-containing protein [Christensenella sp.]|uniref:B12-binding domain-containing radical SAM protein n=1 Tax=Christensenella sp. TaxID=1935934 RepID=UPI002B20C2B3|nr:DUF4080 domain-containing protein [Christensenella sp.]MEA5002849.1 DUF4080 domain-containing protein [Christensenella sp.]